MLEPSEAVSARYVDRWQLIFVFNVLF